MKQNITILVDIQEDFIRGALAAHGAQDVIPEMVRLTEEACKRGDKIIATLDTHTLNDFDEKQTLETQVLPPHVISGTNGHKIIKEIFDVVSSLYKGNLLYEEYEKETFGSYKVVEVVSNLVEQGVVKEIDMFGVCTDICVLSNALMLRSACPGIVINVYAKACAGLTKEAHEAALTVMKSNFINIIE